MILAILNRLLAENPLLVRQLQPFAGKNVAFVIGMHFCWQITKTGLLAPTKQSADAVIRIRLSSLALLKIDRMAFNRSVQIEGDRALGMAFAQVMGQLPWDTEEELSRMLGDVLAHRAMQIGKPLFNWPWLGVQSLLSTMVEYYQQESAEIIGRAELAQFYQRVDVLRADTDRLEKRLERLLTTVTDK